MNASELAIDPVVLNGWPSCTDCVSWSSDGELAVASGESIHILTPKQRSKSDAESDLGTIGLRQWHTARIRTNTFSQQEWPEQLPAPSNGFSVGEEQSLSTVAALAWSPPGLGPYKRSVLGVLTSNYVLSLWESNGTIGEWSRVAVINRTLGDHPGWVDKSDKDVSRAKRRIRAFSWSPPYQLPRTTGDRTSTSKWGVTHLAVANDDEVITILRVSSRKRRGQMKWSMEAICEIQLPATSTNGNAFQAVSLFQKSMMSKTPISSLDWSDLKDESMESIIEVCQRYRTTSIRIQASLRSTPDGTTGLLEHNLELSAELSEVSEQEDSHSDAQNKHIANNADLRKKIEEARIEFDSNHGLDGNSIAREWGFASSDSQDAVCVTLHPSDVVEYSTASMEKCTLLFAGRAIHAPSPPLATASPKDVLFRISSWILSAVSDVPLTLMMDRHLFGISATYAASSNDDGLKQKAALAFSRLRETSESQLDHDEMDIDESELVDALTGSDMETCLICEALIPFDENELSRARCDTGHPYTRCNLSLLTIQEPGISKYCSQCNRQFLNAEEIDLESMQETDGPSLVALLFEEFDVCPYCHAKFRA